MPCYRFECKKCKAVYEEVAAYDETEKYPKIKCPNCKSKSKTQRFDYGDSTVEFIFDDPRKTSKWESITYRYGKTQEEAKECRRNAEAKSHVGSTPYGDVSQQVYRDLNRDSNWR